MLKYIVCGKVMLDNEEIFVVKDTTDGQFKFCKMDSEKNYVMVSEDKKERLNKIFNPKKLRL